MDFSVILLCLSCFTAAWNYELALQYTELTYVSPGLPKDFDFIECFTTTFLLVQTFVV